MIKTVYICDVCDKEIKNSKNIVYNYLKKTFILGDNYATTELLICNDCWDKFEEFINKEKTTHEEEKNN